MNYIHFWRLLILAAIVLFVFGKHRWSRHGFRSDNQSQLARELKRHPVYSAETIQSREAEFIRDRLPKRVPTVLVLFAVLVLGAVAWWLNR